MIKVGDRLPEAEFITMTADGTQKFTSGTVFAGRKVVLFAVPGAFTPTCSMNHMPGFVKEADAIKAKGVDTIACTAVNDVHVMNAWGRQSGADSKILMLADGTSLVRGLSDGADVACGGGRCSAARQSLTGCSPAGNYCCLPKRQTGSVSCRVVP